MDFLNSILHRLTSANQNPTVPQQTPMPGTPLQKLSPAANAELESVFARIPEDLREGVRIWGATGEPPADEQWSSKLASFFWAERLHQLAMETANITCAKKLAVRIRNRRWLP